MKQILVAQARLFCLAMLAALLMLRVQPSLAEERIVVDLSRYDVPVSTGFSGARLLLFGASPKRESSEGDILIKVRGPSQRYIMSRKERVFGLWMDTTRWRISSAPAFFQVITSRNDENWLEAFERRRQAFSFRDLAIPLSRMPPHAANEQEHEQEYEQERQAFRDAFLRRQGRLGLYGELPNSIERLGNSLFRVTLTLPPGLPTGTYIVETFLVEKGKLTSAQATPLFVRRAGGSAFIFNFAERYSFLYGLCAVLIALLAGGLANRLFARS